MKVEIKELTDEEVKQAFTEEQLDQLIKDLGYKEHSQELN